MSTDATRNDIDALDKRADSIESRLLALEQKSFRGVAIGSACGIALLIVFGIGASTIPSAALDGAKTEGEKAGEIAAKNAAKTEVKNQIGVKVIENVESYRGSTVIRPFSLAPFEFHREGAANPEDAARTLFRGVATESPTHFVKHLLLGVCDGPIDTLQKFAECLHVTEFSDGVDTFTFYDLRELRKGINPKKPIRVITTNPFDSEDKQVAALQFEMISTYYGEAFMSVDVAAEGYDGRAYQTRIVVAQLGDHWYAMPRCRSAKSFYEIADAMGVGPRDAKEAK